MTKAQKNEILSMKTVGYWSELGGVELKDIKSDDTLICVSNAWAGKKSVHAVVIRFTQYDRPYIKLYNSRLYLDECIRCY